MDRNILALSHRQRLMAVGCLLPVAACPLWLLLLPPGGFWIARALALVGSATTVAVLTRGREHRALAASPPVVLALLALLFYSLIPAIYAELVLGGPLAIPPGIDSGTFRALPGIPFHFAAVASASPAEGAILCFSAVMQLLVLWLDGNVSAGHGNARHGGLGVAPGIVVVLAAGLTFQICKRLLVDAPSPLLSSMVDFLPPVVTLGIALLATGARQPRERAWAIAGFVCGAALLFPYQMKACALLAGMILLVWAVSLRGASRVFLLATLVVLPVLATLAVQATRTPDWLLWDSFKGKLVERQAETVLCLNFVLREVETNGGDWYRGPFYFAAGLVPRLLWPAKPTLSHGDAYAKAFCGIMDPAQHSASITLLGEPVLRGGVWGGVAAGLSLAGIQALAFAGWKRGRGLLPAAVLGLSPWLIDFDQDFALYVASVVKFGIAVLGVCLVLWFCRRRVVETT